MTKWYIRTQKVHSNYRPRMLLQNSNWRGRNTISMLGRCRGTRCRLGMYRVMFLWSRFDRHGYLSRQTMRSNHECHCGMRLSDAVRKELHGWDSAVFLSCQFVFLLSITACQFPLMPTGKASRKLCGPQEMIVRYKPWLERQSYCHYVQVIIRSSGMTSRSFQISVPDAANLPLLHVAGYNPKFHIHSKNSRHCLAML